MSTTPSDGELWTSFVEATREVSRRQAEFHQQAGDREAVLRAALAPEAPGWEQAAAFDYLRSFPSAVGPLLPELVGWAVESEKWATPAREIVARIPSDRRLPLVEPLLLEHLSRLHDDCYADLAGLAAACGAWTVLERLVRQGENHHEPDVREVVEFYREAYGARWQPTG